MTDAGEVRDGIEGGRLFQADHQIMSQLTRGATCSVCHRHKGRLESLQPSDVLVESLSVRFRLWWEELKGYGGLIGGENVANVH